MKLQEHWGTEPLGEDGGSQDSEDANISDDNALADEVEINLNILGALMLDGVGGEVDRADIVTVDQGGPRQGAEQHQK
jgi:hypothetical protein